MPFAMLSSKVVEYVRVTENCLGTIVASYEDDDKRKEKLKGHIYTTTDPVSY